MATQRRSLVKTILRVLVVLLVAVALAAAGYVGYLSATYYRIDDGIQLEVTGATTANKAQLEHGIAYTVATYNVGFGAYDPSFSFFMGEGWLERHSAWYHFAGACWNAIPLRTTVLAPNP